MHFRDGVIEGQRRKKKCKMVPSTPRGVVVLCFIHMLLSESKKFAVTETSPLASPLLHEVPLKVIVALIDKYFSSTVTLKCKPVTHLSGSAHPMKEQDNGLLWISVMDQMNLPWNPQQAFPHPTESWGIMTACGFNLPC